MDEIAGLRMEGYCILRGVVPRDSVQKVRHDIDRSMKAGLEAYEKRGWSAVTHMLSLAPYLADSRLLEIVRTMFNDVNVRISQTEFKSVPPRSHPREWRGFHTDWPHDLTDRSLCGRVNQPFANIVMSLTSIWMLAPFTCENGATWIVPRHTSRFQESARRARRHRRVPFHSRRTANLRRGRGCHTNRQPHLALHRRQLDRRNQDLDRGPLLALVAERRVRQAQCRLRTSSHL